MLRLRVLGLVIVVPKLACRPWPRRNGVPGPEPVVRVGVWGLIGLEGVLENASSSAASTPFGVGVKSRSSWEPSAGVSGSEDEIYALPSSEFASTRSGGNRSFSMSDLRLQGRERVSDTDARRKMKGIRVIESPDGLLDSFCTQGQSTVRQLGRARHAFEL